MHITLSRFFLLVFILLCGYDLDASVERLRCMWRDNPATTMVIGWDQTAGNSPKLYYDDVDWGMDVSSYRYSQSPDRVVVAKGMNNQFVRLKNLQANTVYYFIIVDGQGMSSKYSFKTATDNSKERLSIVAGGDSRNYRKARRNANKLVARLNPDCVMFGGDMTGGDTGREWIEWFDDWQHTVSKGRLIPIIATRGNHEYSNKTIYNLFDTPNERIYYGLTLGGDLLRIYTLNSLISSGGNQKLWLENDLMSSQHCFWKFAQYHYAIRPHTKGKSERNGQLKNWAGLFYNFGVKLVMESDAHVVKVTHPVRPSREPGSDEGFIRDDERGTIYIGEGCWGAPIRRNNDDKNWTKSSGSFNQFKWVLVGQNNVEVRTIKTDNADMVGFVDEHNRFYPPANLDIWNPNGESVTYLHRNNAVFVKNQISAPAVRTIPTRTTKLSKPSKPMELYEFKVAKEETKQVVSWKTIYESPQRISFEVQRSMGGMKYKTFALVSSRGGFDSSINENNYKIVDDGKYASKGLAYRLKEIRPDGSVFYHKAKFESLRKDKISYKKILSPDPKTGLLKVKYNLVEPGNVRIRLVNNSSKEFSKSNYINQKSGNYLKSIDMSDMPIGKYLLIIRKNENIVDRIEIEKRA